MNVLQRGVRSVLRKPIKSIILLFIVIVMSGLFLGAMASRSASIYTQDATMIIPGLFEPPVRILRATIPENESHIFR